MNFVTTLWNIFVWVSFHPFLSFIGLAVFYVILFKLYYQRKMKFIGSIAAIPFLFLDFLVNLVPMSLFMWDWPKEPLVTGRLKRYKRDYQKIQANGRERWRYGFATKVCEFLNRYDPKGHC